MHVSSIADQFSSAKAIQARVARYGLPEIPAAQREVGAALHLDGLSSQRRRVARGAHLYRSGDHLAALFEVHAGCFKTCLSDERGRTQVTGFQMSGDLLGLDAIGSDRHEVYAVALEDALVNVIPYDELKRLLHEDRSLRHEFHCVMSREIVREQAMMMLLGRMAAEGRIAAFLLDLTQRLQQRGFSPTSLLLRMSREEIGSYLGLQLETVSRAFSKLHCDGVLVIHQK